MSRVKKDLAARPPVERGIPEKVVDILLDTLAIDEALITLDATIMGDLGADSLDVVELMMAFEQEFDIEIDDDVSERWETGTVKDVLASLRALGVKV